MDDGLHLMETGFMGIWIVGLADDLWLGRLAGWSGQRNSHGFVDGLTHEDTAWVKLRLRSK
ncbi:hypothetical protein [Diaphorobacter aerolatus]|uniref:Uncharacterized protein n=1 Tax=Diaphorobacter aerolatus TaxID=1288495 RepID=A0A7H0GHQ9_9BURK|nr:hypothetical protein [Diaphorobacter aerolatus]QNP47825.1 hypothetical protein H9K75_16965 [Diaphorobacter aerolatus]